MRAAVGTSSAPWAPICRLAATSASASSSAQRRSASVAAGTPRGAAWRATANPRASAQDRLTAVGRVARNSSAACSSSRSQASASCTVLDSAAMASPNAAVAPMAGAPRTFIVRIASATSVTVLQVIHASCAGSRVWSSRRSAPGRYSSGRKAGSFPILVADQADDVIAVQPPAALEEVQLHQEHGGGDGPAQLLDQLDGGAHGAAGGQQVVHHQHTLTGADGVHVQLERSGAIFQVVLDGD